MPAPMSQQSPWNAIMSRQAEDIAPRSEMDQGDIPAMTQDQIDMGVSSGALDPRQSVRLVEMSPEAKARTEKVKTRGPMSQEAVPQSQSSQDLVDQAMAQAQEAYLQQKQGIGQLEEDIGQARRLPQGGIDYTPFVSMAKFLNPEVDAASMGQAAESLRPESPQKRAERLISLQNLLQQRKDDQVKVTQAQLTALLKSRDQNSPLATQMKQSTIDKNNSIANAYAQRPAQFDRTIAERVHAQTVGYLKNNKEARQKLQTIQGIDNAMKIITDAPDNAVPGQILHDAQQALIQAVSSGRGGSSGINERAEKQFKSAGIDMAMAKQWLTGEIQNIPGGKENAFYKALQGFAKSERENGASQRGSILKVASGGQDHMYDTHPALKKDRDSLEQALIDQNAEGDTTSDQPQVGDEIDGHVFKGGDPGDPANWEQK